MVEGALRSQDLLDLHHLQKEQVKRNLATANVNLNQADQKLKVIRSRLGNMIATSGSNLTVAATTRNAARIRIQKGVTRKGYAEVMVEQRQQERKGAKRLAATLEKLESRHNGVVLADDLHEEQIILDEIASQQGNAPNATGGIKTKLRHEEIETVRGRR